MAVSMQIGVVPILADRKRPKVVLVTAIGKDRWLVPKGNEHHRHNRRVMAMTEAYEEAGVTGVIETRRYVDVPYRKAGRWITLRLYPMEVKRVLDKWPERHLRKRVIVEVDKADDYLRCKHLSAGVESLARCVCAW